MSLATIRANLELNIANFASGMRSAQRTVQRFNSMLARTAAANSGLANGMIAGYKSLNARLHTFGMGLRDIARIVSGIMISQVFYSATRAIREATSAVWELNESLDYALVTYSSLFNSSSIASDFLSTLKDYSINTIYEYKDLENMARKLLAYGIEYKNLMFIIQGLTNIGVLSGDSAALERLAVTIGQINAKGYLQAEEIRQLANAYTPVYDILESEFGLTRDQLGSIGDLKLPAYEVINAIVKYANEQFGGVATAAMYTIKGLNNRIVDSMRVLGTEILKPFTTFYKSFAFYLGEQLEAMRNAYASGGLGGLFEHLVPDEGRQQRIRTFIASIQNLATSIVALFQTIGPYVAQIIGGLVNGFSAVISVISGVIRGITGLFQAIASNTPVLTYLTRALIIAAAAWAMFKLHGLAAAAVAGIKAAIIGVANAVLFLAKAILANPILTMILLIGGALIGFAASSNNANNAFSKLIDSFNSFTSGGAGTTSDEILQTEEALGGAATNADQFWNAMEEGAAGTEDALDKAGGAAKKAAAGLLSFDEVFKLNQNTGGAGGGGLSSPDFSGIGDVLGGFGGGGGVLPEIPDFSEYTDKFAQGLFGDLFESIKTIASGAATGYIIGALVGFAIGGLVTRTMKGALAGAKLGSKIGTIAGGAFAGFWTDTYKQMEASLLKIAAGAASGALIGGLIGMVVGAFATKTLDGAITAARYGAAIGGLIGGGLGSFWAIATEEMNGAIEGIIVGTGTGALIGGLVGLIIGAFSTRTLQGALAGARLGAKIGAGLGAVFGGFFGSASAELQKAILEATATIAMGALVGGLAGFLLGALVTRSLSGALAGAKLGATVGGVMGASVSDALAESGEAVKEGVSNMFSDVGTVAKGVLIGALVGMLIGAIVGAFAGGIGALPGAKVGAALGGALGGLVSGALDGSGIVESIGAWFGNLGNAIGGFFASAWDWAKNLWNTGWSAVSGWFSNLWTDVSSWFTTFASNVGNAFADAWDWLKNKWNSGWSAVSTWFSNLWTSVSGWFNTFTSDVGSAFANAWDWAKNKWNSGWSAVSTWFSNLWTSVSEWFTNFTSNVGSAFANAWDWAKNTWTTGWTAVSGWFSNLWTKVSEWFTGLTTDVGKWFNGLWNIENWIAGWEHIKQWFANLWNDIAGWFSDLAKSVSDWWDSLWSGKEPPQYYVSGKPLHVKSNEEWYYSPQGGKTNKGNGSSGGTSHDNTLLAYASGGIVSRDQIARIAEGNKREAIIPLENETAMRPFSDAVSNNLLQTILPAVASVSGGSGGNSLPPMYVGTLVADERGIQQLYKKFQLIEAKELARKGMA